MVVYIHKHSPQKSKQIDSLRYWYQTMFQQQSILKIDKKVKVSFLLDPIKYWRDQDWLLQYAGINEGT